MAAGNKLLNSLTTSVYTLSLKPCSTRRLPNIQSSRKTNNLVTLNSILPRCSKKSRLNVIKDSTRRTEPRLGESLAETEGDKSRTVNLSALVTVKHKIPVNIKGMILQLLNSSSKLTSGGVVLQLLSSELDPGK